MRRGNLIRDLPILGLLLLAVPVFAGPTLATGLLYNGERADYVVSATVEILPPAVWPLYGDLMFSEDAWAGGICTPLSALPEKLRWPVDEGILAVMRNVYVGGVVERSGGGEWSGGGYARWTLLDFTF